MPKSYDKAPFSVRLRDVESDLLYGAAVTGETRSAFIRRAIRERARRHLERAQGDGGVRGQCERQEAADR